MRARLLTVMSSLFALTCAGPDGPQDQPEELRGLFSRLAEPQIQDDSRPRLVLREGPAVPARGTVERPFPPREAARRERPARENARPLRVLSAHPRGEDDVVGAVRVTFDQPMVELAALSELRATEIPIRIHPQPDGRFRWLGTSTIAFEPTGDLNRMPGATEFRVRVPAGTRSAIGGVLAEDFTFSFETPPPTVRSITPHEHATEVDLRPMIVACFDQRVDGERLVSRLRLEGPNAPPLEPVPAAEQERTGNVTLGACEDDRRVIARPARALAKGSSYRVVVPAGTLGTEGPLPTREDSATQFTTYNALRVTQAYCGDCRPGDVVSVGFTTTIAGDQDLREIFTVEPEVPRLEVTTSYGGVALTGDWAAQTDYTIRVRAGVRDIHRQTLAREATLAVSIGDAPPSIELGAQTYATLEIDSPRAYPIDLMNTRTVTARAAPIPRESLADAIEAVESGWGPWQRPEPDPFQRLNVVARPQRLTTRSPRNVEDRVGIPLGIPDGEPGYALVEVTIPEPGTPGYMQYALVQATDLAVVTMNDAFGATVRVTSLSTGRPIEGASIRIEERVTHRSWRREATTGPDGVARVRARLIGSFRVIATKGDDQAFDLVSGFTRPGARVAGTIFTDRNPYRPGDTVHLRLFTRERPDRPAGRLRAWPARTRAECRVRDPHWSHSRSFSLALDAYGSASRDIPIAADAPTGEWNVECTIAGLTETLSGGFRVEEYRAPEVEVEVTPPRGTRFTRTRGSFVIESRYLFGAPAADLPVQWTLGRERTSYAPPGHDAFVFGDHTHWGGRPWIGPMEQRRHGRNRWVHVRDDSQREIIESSALAPARLDREGKLTVPARLLAPDGAGPAPYRFVLEAEVVDASRQSVAGRAEVIAHPSSLYVGLRNERPFVTERDAIRVSAIATEVGGRIAEGKSIRIRALERRTRLVHRQTPSGMWTFDWENESREVGSCDLTSGAEPVECRIEPQRPGSYVIEARVTDERERENVTSIGVWVSGRGFVPNGAEERVEVVSDRESYRAGDTARLLIRAPFGSGRGLLAIEKQGAIEIRPIDLEGSLSVVEVPITADHVPEVNVRVALARGRASEAELRAMLEDAGPDAMRAAEEDVGGPAYASGGVALRVDPAAKTLTVEVQPERERSEPGQPLSVRIQVRAPNGRPARAGVTIAVVDEGVLSLLGYETPDPVPSLHPPLQSTLSVQATHTHVVRRRPMRALRARENARYDALQSGALAPPRVAMRAGGGTGEGTIGLGNLGTIGHGGGGGTGSGYGRGAGRSTRNRAADPMEAVPEESADVAGAIPVSARGLFATTAYYRALIETDTEGRASVRFDLPDNLTTFRIMAIAIGTDDRSGRGEARVEVRKRLLLRPALPRFATLGDRFDASVVVHNETGEERDVTVGVRAAGLEIEGDPFRRVRMRSGEAREVHFPARVTAGAGRGKIQFAASAGDAADAVETERPFAEPATAEAFATYGSSEAGHVRVPVRVPEGVVDRYGGLELTLSSTALTGLDDAADYLFEYPYACAEQHSSKLIAASALSSILEGRDEAARERARARGAEAITALFRLQRADGGFVYWPGAYRTELYTSSFAVLALADATRAGFEVDARKLARALRFLEHRVRNPWHEYGERRDWVLQASALYALAQGGQRPPADLVERVWSHREDLPVFGKAWLMIAIRSSAGANDPRVAELWREIENAAVETPSGAHFAEREIESARLLWHSERRTDAIVLAAMLAAHPDHPLVERTVRALIAARRNGRWSTTQENAWSLSSLARYYRAHESVAPDLSVDAWLGTRFIGTTEMRGRSAAIFDGMVPMEALREMSSGELVLAREGDGRVYYRIGLRYAPEGGSLPPEEQGFSITRSYEAVENDADVRRDREGVWHVRAESTVRVRLTIVVPDDRYDVAIDDPLPAGFEAVNMAFDTTASQRLSGELDERRTDIGSFWALFAFEHRELRDDRVVAFSRHAHAGVYELTYLARATTPGRFAASPAHAEEMYAPEVFGRTATAIVVVERGSAGGP